MQLEEITNAANVAENNLKVKLRSAGRFATGETQSKIKTTVVQTGNGVTVSIVGPQSIWALEKGRKPTRPGATKGSPTLVEQIERWMTAKGLVGSPWPIAQKIHKEGYKGTPGLITGWQKDSVQSIKKAAAQAYAKDIIARLK